MSDILKARIAEIFNEPGCDKNQAKDAKDRKKGCAKPLTPGAAAGGCAFDGAKIALQPLTDVVHLVHGPLACEGNGWDNRHASSSGPSLYRTGFTTDLTEMDIVMGNGEKRLYRAIKEAIARHNPPAVFVYATCVPVMTLKPSASMRLRNSARPASPSTRRALRARKTWAINSLVKPCWIT